MRHSAELGHRTCTSNGGKCLVLAALVGILICVDASAQPAVEENTSIFQAAPSDVRRPMMRAEKALAEGRYADAAYELGALLTIEDTAVAESQDYFLVETDTAQAPLQLSLRGRIQQMLAALPAEGRQAYELQFGAQARALLDEALSQGNMDQLGAVIRRFLHTQAGYEASVLAGRYELGCGRPMAAALHFERVSRTASAAARFEPELSFLLAACWMYADMPEKARETLVTMRGRSGGDSIQLGETKVPLFQDNADALAWFEDLLGRRQPLMTPEVTEWALHRGNPQRNARTPGSLPLLSYRWRVPTCIDRADEVLIEKLSKQYRDETRAAIPVLQPLAVGDTILMRTPQKLLGVDFSSGKRIWVWPPWESDAIDPWSAGREGE
jgi:hypothetical protein